MKNNSKSKGFKPSYKGKQGRKDSSSKRVNFDNERVRKFDEHVEDAIENGSKGKGANDITDFNRNQELLKSAGSLPFATILGNKNLGDGSTKSAVPGIMTYVYNATYAATDASNTVSNKAFQQLFSFIVHANSRTGAYEYTDDAMYCMAGIDVFAAIAEATRVYGTIMHYSEQNMYLADALVEAMGFIPEDIRRNRGQMWFDINNLIMQTKQIWIPDVMPILQRYIRLNSYIYTDAAGERSQIYVPVRQSYYMLSEIGNTNGTCLAPALIEVNNNWEQFRRQNNPMSGPTFQSVTWDQFKTMIQNMIDQLVASQDRGTIYGDILKAYGADKIYAMPSISADYIVIPQYNAEVLMQIENITVSPNYEVTGFTQNHDNNVLRFTPVWSQYDAGTTDAPTVRGMATTQVLNTHIASQPTPEAIMIATRLKSGGINGNKKVNTWLNLTPTAYPNEAGWVTASTQTANLPIPSTVGSELCIGIWTIRMMQISGVTETSRLYQQVNVTDVTEEAALMDLMAFDWHPFIYSISTSSFPYIHWDVAWGDFDNYIIISDEELNKLNEVAAYSLWGVPHI